MVGLVRNGDIVGDLDLRDNEAVLRRKLLAHLADAEGEFLMRAEEPRRHHLTERQFDFRGPQHRFDGVLFQLLALDDLLFLLLAAGLVVRFDLPWDEPCAEGHDAAEEHERNGRQTGHQAQNAISTAETESARG